MDEPFRVNGAQTWVAEPEGRGAIQLRGRVAELTRQWASARTGVQRAESELQRHRTLTESALQRGKSALWDWRVQDGYDYRSGQFARLLGYDPNDLDFDFGSWEEHVVPEDRAGLYEKLREHLDASRSGPFEVMVRYLQRDGGTVWILSRGEVVEREADGRAKRVVGLHVDVTAYERHRHVAEQAVNQKAAFLANLAHELRTPLNSISGVTQMLSAADANAEDRECLEVLKHSTDHLLHLLNNILDFNRLDSGVTAFEKLPFSLSDSLETVVQSQLMLAESKGLQMEAEVSANVPDVIRGDPYRLNQILLNLVNNAIKFTHEGEVRLRAMVESCDSEQIMIRIDVRDTGIGIAPGRLEAVFKPFAQARADTARSYGGSGLGLAICRQLAVRQGGSLEARSEEGSGSTFTLVLPFELERGQDEESVGTPGRLTRHRRLHCLLVEDNAQNAFVARSFLERWGYRCTYARTGVRALELAGQGRFDVILMDVRVPGADGLDIVRTVRNSQDAQRRQTPVVVVTAQADGPTRRRAEGAGVDAFLAKPYLAQELQGAIDRAIEARLKR